MQLATFRRAVLSFVWVVGAFAVYTVCAVPFIEPPRADVASDASDGSEPPSTSTARYMRELAHLFPAGSWELDKPMVLRSDRVTVLIDEYQQLDNDGLRIKKCTLILYDPDTAGESRGPTILQAPEGAELVFDKPMDFRKGMFDGKPVSGRLLGRIRIFSSGGNQGDDFVLETRDVEISAKRIWTRQRVAFQWGEHFGAGRDLMITPVSDAKGGTLANDDNPLGSLGMVQLQQLERLTVAMPARQSLRMPFSSNSPAPIPQSATQKVHLTSQGPILFDLQNQIATIEKDVRITTGQVGDNPDSIRADKLVMHMATEPQKTSQTNEGDVDPSAESGLVLRRVVAVGNPVVIDAPSYHAYIESQQIEYDLITGQVKMRPKNATPADAATTSSVYVRGLNHELEAPSIDLVAGQSPMEWRLLAGGPGRFRGSVPGQNQPVDAVWQERVTLQPQGAHQVLRIVGDAHIDAHALGRVECPIIEVWMKPDRVVVAQDTVTGQPIEETRINPTKLVTLAAGKSRCSIEAPQLRASLSKMTVILESSRRGAPEASLISTAPQSLGNRPRSQRLPPAEETQGPTSVFHLDGGELIAWVRADSQKLRRAQLSGPSRIVEQTSEPRAGIELVASAVDYLIDARGVPSATIDGQPAVLKSDQIQVQGSRIQLSGPRNQVSVPGPGTMRIAVPEDVFDNRGRDKQVVATIPIDLAWQGVLSFDGSALRLDNQVEIRGTDLRLRTSRLVLTLDQQVNLSKLQGQTIRPQIQRVLAAGGVRASGRTRDEAGGTATYQQVAAQDLDFQYQTGEVLARGPGWLAVTTKSAGVATFAANATPAPDDNELRHLRVEFEDQLAGNLHRREMQLNRNVRAWYGPVQTWDAQVDLQSSRQLGKQDILMHCNDLYVLESPSRPRAQTRGPIELLARGQTRIESKDFQAEGYQIKYAEEKEMLTLEGSQQRPAEVWRKNPSGGPPALSGRARRIRYWLRTQELDVQDAPGLDISQLPQSSQR